MRRTLRASIGMSVWLAISPQARPQQPTPTAQTIAGNQAMQALSARIDAELTSETLSLSDSSTRRTVGMLAKTAVLLVETDRCADPLVFGFVAQHFLSRIIGTGNAAMQPIYALPDDRKTELADTAMKLASRQLPDDALAATFCPGGRLSSATPQEKREHRTRHILSLALLPPTSLRLPQPFVTDRVAPLYPKEARRANQEGGVLLALSVGTNGNVSTVSIVDSSPVGVFDEAAQVAARQYHYAPKCSASFDHAFVIYQYFRFTLSDQPPLPLPPILVPYESARPRLELSQHDGHAYLGSVDPCASWRAREGFASPQKDRTTP